MRTWQLIDARSQTFQALLRRSRGNESSSVLPPVLWTKTVSQKVKVLREGVTDARFLLVQGQSDTGHHVLRPHPRLRRVSTAQDHKIVRIGDNFRPPFLSLSLQ